jgi:hypothetical protein
MIIGDWPWWTSTGGDFSIAGEADWPDWTINVEELLWETECRGFIEENGVKY